MYSVQKINKSKQAGIIQMGEILIGQAKVKKKKKTIKCVCLEA